MDINLYQIIQMCQKSSQIPIIEVDFNSSILKQALPLEDIERYLISLKWHAPVFFSLLANSGMQKACRQLLIILSMVL